MASPYPIGESEEGEYAPPGTLSLPRKLSRPDAAERCEETDGSLGGGLVDCINDMKDQDGEWWLKDAETRDEETADGDVAERADD